MSATKTARPTRAAQLPPGELSAEIVGGELVIRIGIEPELRLSATGKTLSVASSRGNKRTAVQINGSDVFVGVNAYIYPPRV